VVDAELTSVRVGGAFSGVVALIEVAGILAIVALGTWAIGSDRLTIGGLLAFLAYLSQLLRPVGNLSQLAATLLAASAGAERVMELLDQRPRVRDRPYAKPLGRATGAIELTGVRFAYPGTAEPALDGVTLRIARGEVVAVCGPSGAGKSTLARLIARFVEPDDGAVLLDGRDLRGITLASLRDNVGVLAQETMLFDASVRDNIAFGRPDATDAEIGAAARAAGAHDFVCDLPDGYDTRVGQRGQRLSGGQRRRVEVARTLLRDTPVVILDEPTSGLDRAAAHRLGDPLRALMRGRTAIVVTHDPALADSADRVLHVEGGRLMVERALA
jgi:ABC-type multidrug transport system fused ATPase/permease subunit